MLLLYEALIAIGARVHNSNEKVITGIFEKRFVSLIDAMHSIKCVGPENFQIPHHGVNWKFSKTEGLEKKQNSKLV